MQSGDIPAGAGGRSSARTLASLPEAILAAARDTGTEAAEVFLKEAGSLRCVFGLDGARSFEWREENGVALRAWYPGGREGFVHSDGASAPLVRPLAEAARLCASLHPGGSVPRLPQRARSGSGASAERSPWREGAGPGGADSADAPVAAGPFPSGPSGGASRSVTSPGPEEAIRGALETLLGGLRAAAARGVRFRGGFVETGEFRSRVANTAGGDASFRRAIARVSLSLSARVGEAVDRRSEGAPIETAWYAAEEETLDSLDAQRLIEDAVRRAGLSRGGAPREGGEIRVLLDPVAAAVWARALAALLSVRSGDVKGGRCEGFDLLDDPAPPAIDGEGRPAATRVLVRSGLPVPGGGGPAPLRRDSYRDLPAPGPMRLRVAPGAASPEELLHDLDRGAWVTALAPRSSPGSSLFVAEVRGAWVDRGKPVNSLSRTLLLLPEERILAGVLARGAGQRLDETAVPVITPPLLLEGAALVAM